MQQQVIELGKALVKELDVELGVDTLTRWMAHYLAGLLKELETAGGKAKEESQGRCFEAILTLWHHRAYYQNGHRPFENFEPIFRLLESLNPEDGRYFYFRGAGSNPNSLDYKQSNVQEWVNVSLKIDELARILISYSLQRAAVEATDEETIKWLKNSISLLHNDDIEVILKLIEPSSIANKLETLNNDTFVYEKALKTKLERINELSTLCDFIRSDIAKELHYLNNPEK